MNIAAVSSAALAALVLVGASAPAAADIVTIEPDDYAADSVLTHIGPGLVLFNFRKAVADPGPSATNVLATPWGLAAPTGTQVFGHIPPGPSNHWAGIQFAKDCVGGLRCAGRFYVFTAYFSTLTSKVEVRTTLMPWALDGAELWAFSSTAKPLAACYVGGVTDSVRRTGEMPNPTYGSRIYPVPVPLVECGKVLAKRDCEAGGLPGECSYIVTAGIERSRREIAFVMWGAYRPDDSTAPVDRLRYEY